MTNKELRGLSETKLKEEILELRKEQFIYNMQVNSDQAKNTAKSSIIRKKIARAKTVLNEKVK